MKVFVISMKTFSLPLHHSSVIYKFIIIPFGKLYKHKWQSQFTNSNIYLLILTNIIVRYQIFVYCTYTYFALFLNIFDASVLIKFWMLSFSSPAVVEKEHLMRVCPSLAVKRRSIYIDFLDGYRRLM